MKNDEVDSSRQESLVDIINLKIHFPIKGGGLFRRKYVRAVDDVSFSIEKYRITGLVGESGCGKTTLARAIIRLERPTEGKITFEGRDIWSFNKTELKSFRRSVQMIFQDPFASLDPLRSVFENLALPLSIHGIKKKSDMRELCARALEEVKLPPEYLDKYPHQLSGGERQRVCIARAMILKPRFIIADEPTSMIDASIKGEICKLLIELKNKHNLTLLLISHDLGIIRSLSDVIIVMYLGKVVEILSSKRSAEFLHPYSQLLTYASDFSVEDERLSLRSDVVPSAINPPSGCRFHPRCIFATEKCRREAPELKEVKPNHYVACFLFNHK